MVENYKAVTTTCRIALRMWANLSDAEREAVLIALVESGEGDEAEIASQTLYHLRKQREHQMQLKGFAQ